MARSGWPVARRSLILGASDWLNPSPEGPSMRRILALSLLMGAFAFAAPGKAAAQDTGSHLIAVGQKAPDFALPGATRYGVLKDPVRLSDYKGETVVLAFFFRVRTPG